MFKKILVPVDGSEHSDCAVETAADLAVRYDCSVEVLHVMEEAGTSRLPAGLEDLARIEQIRITDTDVLMGVANSIVSRAVNRCRELGVKQVEDEVVIGNPTGGYATRGVPMYGFGDFCIGIAGCCPCESGTKILSPVDSPMTRR